MSIRMSQIAAAVAHNQKTVIVAFASCVFVYFFTMDTILYSTYRTVDLVDEKRNEGEPWNPFHPLSVKLLMTDHCTHYIITPLSEYFNDITKFSQIFYFVTPNMITLCHLIVAFISAKFVYSDSLHSRRIGVLLYEFRSFLDSFDGTIYRSRASNKLYVSDHSNFGFWMDSTCDTLAGFCLSFAALFTLWWKIPPKKDSPGLPWTKEDNLKHSNGHAIEQHSTRTNGTHTKLFIFWTVFCYGGILGLSSAMWDQTLEKYNIVFMTRMDQVELARAQSEALHSSSTWVLIWLWRVLEGQALLQMILVAIFIDKLWEFLRFIQYLGFAVVGLLVLVSSYHANHIKEVLHL